MSIVIQAVLLGMLAMLAGTIPRNLLFAGNLAYYPNIPWAVPAVAVFLWFYWRYLKGAGPPPETSEFRQQSLRANRLSGRVWAAALIAGGLGIVALVLGLQLVNRLVVLPEQKIPDLSQVPRTTLVPLFLMSSLVAGVVEEASFRGYMQAPIERRFGVVVAILITGTMFAVAHLDFTLVLWPYYVAVAALYGTVTYLTNSILPAVVLHTVGNTYSNFDIWLHGQAEWQAAAGVQDLVWETGPDRAFWATAAGFVAALVATVLAYRVLARVSPVRRPSSPPPQP